MGVKECFRRLAPAAAVCVLAATLPAQALGPSEVSPALQAAVDGDWRSSQNKARDVWRHPGQTLAFFRVQPQHTVIEITPGGGWYAEILAPWLRDSGRYVAAVVDAQSLPEDKRDFAQRMQKVLGDLFAKHPAQFDKAATVAYDPQKPVFGAPGSADAVLTFRNVHNWRFAGQDEGMLRGFFAVLKPGGILGVVEHRAKEDVPAEDRSGYVGQQQIIALAESVGFKLDATSEINANPKDSKDHPKGVWMLPPTNNHEAQDAERYRAMGESDRMTLRFVKPAS